MKTNFMKKSLLLCLSVFLVFFLFSPTPARASLICQNSIPWSTTPTFSPATVPWNSTVNVQVNWSTSPSWMPAVGAYLTLDGSNIPITGSRTYNNVGIPTTFHFEAGCDVNDDGNVTPTYYTMTIPQDAPPPATVNVNMGSCPAGSHWTSSNGYSGNGTGNFSFVPNLSGTNVSISSTAVGFAGTIPAGSQLVSPGQPYTFDLNCLPPTPPTVTLSTNLTSLACSQTATLTWSSAGATSCSAPWTSSIATSGNQAGIGAGTYNITCLGPGGSTVSAPVTITSTGGSCAVPGVSVTASPTSISSGGSSLVTWSSSNATSCSSDWWSGSTALNSSASVSPVVTTTYTKTCSNANGSNSGSATVTVNPVASVTLLPASQSIVSGGSATLTWAGTNVSSCSGTAPTANWNSSSATSGSKSVTPASTATYTIQCVSSVGGANPTASATVNVTSSSATISVSNNTSGSWTIGPIGAVRSGSTSVTVSPAAGGTWYSITPAAVSGFNFPPTITNSDGGGSLLQLSPGQSKSFTLFYTNFNYSLSNNGAVSVLKGGVNTFGQSVITKTLTPGSTPQSVDISLSGVPSGVTYAISSQTCSPTCTSTITFTVAPSTAAGTYPITVTGSPLGRTTAFNLVIVPSTAVVVTCTPSSPNPLVGVPVTWNSTVSGGSGTYSTYSWAGSGISTSPAPSTASFTMSYSTVGPKTAQLTVTDSIGNVGSCVPGTLQVSFNPKFQEF